MATPTVAAIRRCGSRVAASDMTTKVTWPGSSRFMPCVRDRMRHLGGKMLDTRTRLQAAMPAERSASSNDVSFSRCLPTPFVKNISFGTNPITSRSCDVASSRVRGRESLHLRVARRRTAGPFFVKCMVNSRLPTVKETCLRARLFAVLVSGAAGTIFMATEVGQRAVFDQQMARMEASGRQLSDARVDAFERMLPYYKYFALVLQLVMFGLGGVIVAALALAVFNALLGGD